MFEIEGFEFLSTQAFPVSRLFMKHPDIAIDFKLNCKGLKTAYMNTIISLIKTLCRPPKSFSETELSSIDSDLRELTEACFKLDWLKTKLEEVSLLRKKEIADDLRVQKLEERVKSAQLTLSDIIVELETEKAKSAAAASKLLSFFRHYLMPKSSGV
ncbi:PREDICTED: MATH domain and coiled-coil domain-containing protein At2g42465-like [Camelina sativa]|uniref:MATH domain and coiled-coil domain-containing protein At2g42465-like n=1 Tax=Camelina sativa TaxID=90675 RepID=A0ABM0XRM3_CAMSA|nr:PREDICTED: MATH domain and coiled-coil domain-containing protein At2g42465-like [Camelina sativa]